LNPFFFGSRARKLFGVLHEPAEPGSEAVLLCQPGPQQAMRMGWLVRRVASQLASAGFPAMRFDYFATGDSTGDSGTGSLAQWREDVLTAAEEIKDRTGAGKVSAIGLRLGATLFASCPDLNLSRALLWEPVVDGATYLNELAQFQRKHLERNQLEHTVPADELLGYPLPLPEQEQIRALNLRSSPHCAASRWTLIAGKANPALGELDTALRAEGHKVSMLLDEAAADPAPNSTDSLLYSNEIANALLGAFRQMQ
jgi:hypothetical protein